MTSKPSNQHGTRVYKAWPNKDYRNGYVDRKVKRRRQVEDGQRDVTEDNAGEREINVDFMGVQTKDDCQESEHVIDLVNIDMTSR